MRRRADHHRLASFVPGYTFYSALVYLTYRSSSEIDWFSLRMIVASSLTAFVTVECSPLRQLLHFFNSEMQIGL